MGHRNFRRELWLFGLLVLAPSLASSDDRSELTEVLIRGANPGYGAISDIERGTTDRFLRSDLELYPLATADQFLHQIPGFSLFRRSPSLSTHPTGQGVSLRGSGPSGASRTLVLMDGVPLNDPFGGWINWARVPTESLERLEVREGWGGHHYSYLGSSGVIEMQTKEPSTSEGRARLSVGNKETGSGNGYISGTRGRAGGLLGGQYFSAEGYPVVAAGDRGAIDIPAGSDHRLGYGKGSYTLDGGGIVSVYGNVFDEGRNSGTPLTGSQTTSSIASVTARLPGLDHGVTRLTAFGVLSEFQSTFSSQSPDRMSEMPASDQYDVPSRAGGLDVDYSVRSGSHFIEVGGDAFIRSGETRERYRFLEGEFSADRNAGARQYAGGVYGYVRSAVNASTVVDIYGRLNGWQTASLHRREMDLVTGETTRNDASKGDFELFPEARLQLSQRFMDGHSARAALIYGARIPTINELVRPFRVRNDITEANPDLDREKNLTVEADYQYRAGSWRLVLTPYASQVRDFVANTTVGAGEGIVSPCGFVPEGGVCRQRKNIPEAWVGGAEAAAEYAMNEYSSLSLRHLTSLSRVSDAGDSVELRGKQLSQLPRQQVVARAELTFPRAKLALQGRYAGSQFENDLNTLELEPFMTVDAALTMPLASNSEIVVTAENLLGNRYEVGQSADGVTTVGSPALFTAGLRLRF